jgi:UDP-2,3-diacylglucosamine hydrolase
MVQGLVLSDLHIFARRSRAAEMMEKLQDVLSEADVLVLNGDIFDFRWTTLPGISETVTASVRWLEDIVSRFPACRVYFIAGNHDCHLPFTMALDELSSRFPSFFWRESHLVLGNMLFLHGDCIHTRSRSEGGLYAYRRRWMKPRKRGRAENAVYDAVNRSGLPRRALGLYFRRPRFVARRILSYVDGLGLEHMDQVREIFVGHTHVAFLHFEFRGKRFHNTGCALYPASFNPLRFELRE